MKKSDIILSIILLIGIVLLAVLLPIVLKTAKTYAASNDFADSFVKFQQENVETIFSIDKITYFSSCNAKGDTNSNSSFTISDLYQYTDIAIFLNPYNENSSNEIAIRENSSNENQISENLSSQNSTGKKSSSENLISKNTLKSVTISDIEYDLKPSIGTQNLYYKSISDFAKPEFHEENLVKDSITFDTTSENEIDYSKPILYNNCANPITLCYVNSNLKDNYTFSNDISNLTYNGSLLKMCGITLSSLNCQISFTITITNNLDEKYSCPLILNIPLSTESSTIYDGNLTIKDSANYKFIKAN